MSERLPKRDWHSQHGMNYAVSTSILFYGHSDWPPMSQQLLQFTSFNWSLIGFNVMWSATSSDHQLLSCASTDLARWASSWVGVGVVVEGLVCSSHTKTFLDIKSEFGQLLQPDPFLQSLDRELLGFSKLMLKVIPVIGRFFFFLFFF